MKQAQRADLRAASTQTLEPGACALARLVCHDASPYVWCIVRCEERRMSTATPATSDTRLAKAYGLLRVVTEHQRKRLRKRPDSGSTVISYTGQAVQRHRLRRYGRNDTQSQHDLQSELTTDSTDKSPKSGSTKRDLRGESTTELESFTTETSGILRAQAWSLQL